MSPTTSPALPFSQACENNRAPILAVLQAAFADRRHVLEIGSGTGQHSVYFAPRLPHLVWQTSDLPENHAGIAAWHAAHPAPNLRPPLCFDLQAGAWPPGEIGEASAYDAVFSSNTAHIVASPLVQRMFVRGPGAGARPCHAGQQPAAAVPAPGRRRVHAKSIASSASKPMNSTTKHIETKSRKALEAMLFDFPHHQESLDDR